MTEKKEIDVIFFEDNYETASLLKNLLINKKLTYKEVQSYSEFEIIIQSNKAKVYVLAVESYISKSITLLQEQFSHNVDVIIFSNYRKNLKFELPLIHKVEGLEFLVYGIMDLLKREEIASS
ncbi:hypothetical protein HON22_00710 [Candidatus Peregrinibacteria bacterium]|jgi:hypothetical protein|nr:hypothetical protein [Candidatus Peregrinibacteria bacterium]